MDIRVKQEILEEINVNNEQNNIENNETEADITISSINGTNCIEKEIRICGVPVLIDCTITTLPNSSEEIDTNYTNAKEISDDLYTKDIDVILSKNIQIASLEGSDKSFECNICMLKFSLKDSLKRHMIEKHTKGTKKHYICSQCPYQTNYKNHYQRHLNVHSGIKPFHCEICSVRFTRKDTLYTHIKDKHTEGISSVYKCSQCSYHTNHKSHYQTHLITHTGIKPYQCDICMAGFSQKGSLKAHLRDKHTEGLEKDFKCPKCPYETNHKNHFQNHLNTHSDVKPFLCDICMTRFSQKDSLKTHIRDKHREGVAKDYECSICNYQTNHTSHFRAHLKTHAKEKYSDTQHVLKPFICDTCTMGFTRKIQLIAHIKEKHKKNSAKSELK